jgi:hypothetical protein
MKFSFLHPFQHILTVSDFQGMSADFMSQFYLALWVWYRNIHFVSLAFTSRPASLLVYLLLLSRINATFQEIYIISISQHLICPIEFQSQLHSLEVSNGIFHLKQGWIYMAMKTTLDMKWIRQIFTYKDFIIKLISTHFCKPTDWRANYKIWQHNWIIIFPEADELCHYIPLRSHVRWM